MLCEHCHGRAANVHITEIINGQKTELHLCSECATKENRIHAYRGGFREMFNSFFAEDPFFITSPKIDWEDRNGPIGISQEKKDNYNKGLLGSEPDYKKFCNHLKSVIHDKSKKGDVGKEDINMTDTKEDTFLSNLEKQLNDCIEKENFEEAAKIRDQIKKYKDENSSE